MQINCLIPRLSEGAETLRKICRASSEKCKHKCLSVRMILNYNCFSCSYCWLCECYYYCNYVVFQQFSKTGWAKYQAIYRLFSSYYCWSCGYYYCNYVVFQPFSKTGRADIRQFICCAFLVSVSILWVVCWGSCCHFIVNTYQTVFSAHVCGVGSVGASVISFSLHTYSPLQNKWRDILRNHRHFWSKPPFILACHCFFIVVVWFVWVGGGGLVGGGKWGGGFFFFSSNLGSNLNVFKKVAKCNWMIMVVWGVFYIFFFIYFKWDMWCRSLTRSDSYYKGNGNSEF